LTSCGFAYLNDRTQQKTPENVAFKANYGSKFQKWTFKAEKASLMDAYII
jgi:hypothetical protein